MLSWQPTEKLVHLAHDGKQNTVAAWIHHGEEKSETKFIFFL